MSNTERKLVVYGGAGLTILLLIWLFSSKIKAWIDNIRRNRSNANVGTQNSPEQLASRLYAAMFENDWAGITEDEAAMFEVAAVIGRMGNWAAVQEAYRRMYRNWRGNPRNLVEDVQRALTAQEYERFIRLVNG